MSDIVILGLSITSSWGNGHATTYRSLVRGLAARGHRVLFLERDQPSQHRGLKQTAPSMGIWLPVDQHLAAPQPEGRELLVTTNIC